MKRSFDIIVSLLTLIILSPVISVTALLIRLKIGSPVFFKQQRPGLNDIPFYVYKFRSMTDERDEHGDLLPDDVRLTSFGQVIRKLSLDELPQLLNVLKGEMSFVGPRPLLMEYLPLYNRRQARRHDARPGITGWAQVNGRNAISWEEKFELDVWYVENLSFWLDIKILFMTVLKVFKSEGISQVGQVTMTKFEGNIASPRKVDIQVREIVIIGDSGHAKVIADIVNSNDDMSVCAKLDDKYKEVFVEDGLLKGPVRHLDELIESNPEIRVVIGIGSNAVRKKIVSNLRLTTEMYVRAVHSTAIVSPSAKIGTGAVIMPGAIINADVSIGNHVIVNSASVVEHDCIVGDFAHISPLAVLTGGVVVGEGTHIGASASVIPLKKIGAWSTVGAGAVVVSDIEDRVTVVGAPARVVREKVNK